MRRGAAVTQMESVTISSGLGSRTEQQRRRTEKRRRPPRRPVAPTLPRAGNRRECGPTTILVAVWLLVAGLLSAGTVLMLASSLINNARLWQLGSHSAVHTWLDNIVEKAVHVDSQGQDVQGLPDNLSLVVNGTIWDMVPAPVPSSEAVQWQSYELDDLLSRMFSANSDDSQELEAASLTNFDGSDRVWEPELAAKLGHPLEVAVQVWVNNTVSLVTVGPVSLLSIAGGPSTGEACSGGDTRLRKQYRPAEPVCRKMAFLASMCLRLERSPGAGWHVAPPAPQHFGLRWGFLRRAPTCSKTGLQMTWSPAVPYNSNLSMWRDGPSRLPLVRVEVQVAASESATRTDADQVQFEQYGMWLLLLGGLLALPAAGASVLRARWRRAPGVPYETMVPRGNPDYDADVE